MRHREVGYDWPLLARSAPPFAALFLIAALATSAAADVHGVPLPARSRPIGETLHESSLGFRKTVDFYQRWLRRQGIDHERIPVYRYRGVSVARFLAREQSARWRAIHVFHHRGRTRIAIIPTA
jgi:hypothetical protein